MTGMPMLAKESDILGGGIIQVKAHSSLDGLLTKKVFERCCRYDLFHAPLKSVCCFILSGVLSSPG